jgi:NADPH:quinone reductase-like Zn-dependent oxidoreductase
MTTRPSIPDTIPTILHNVKEHSLSLLDHETPIPTSSQYLIEVHATTFTAGELQWAEPNSLTDPIPGFDLAGIVVSTPINPPTRDEVYQIGTKVYGLTSFSRHGNARSLTVAEHSEISPLPETLSFDVAAAIPLSALTAWQALFDHAGLTPEKDANTGKRVLITAASGGVGIWLVQLATWAGVHVTGTCSAANIGFVKSLGAIDAFDYKTVDLDSSLQGNDDGLFDIVFDCVGGETLQKMWTFAKSGGVVTSIALPPDIMKPAQGVKEGVRSFWFVVEPNATQLLILGKLVELKAISAQIDSAWEFNDFQKAIQRVSSGHVSGKVVLKVK